MMEDGFLDNNSFFKLTQIVQRINSELNFDIAETDNIGHSIILSKMEEIAEKLGYEKALERIQEIKKYMKVKAFHRTRTEVFKHSNAELHIWHKEFGEQIDLEELLGEMFIVEDE